MQDVFCIISAIGVDYGVFNYQQRFYQLLETINSIKKYHRTAHVCLIEVSEKKLNHEDVEILKYFVDDFRDCVDHPIMQKVVPNLATKEQDTNLFARKTIGELLGLIEFTDWCLKKNNNFGRVFKMSGRLKLNNEFSVATHYEKSNDILMAPREWFGEKTYLTQLWSFDYSLIQKMHSILIDILEDELNNLQQNSQLYVIEKILYNYFRDQNFSVREHIGYLGIEGFHGQDGAPVIL